MNRLASAFLFLQRRYKRRRAINLFADEISAPQTGGTLKLAGSAQFCLLAEATATAYAPLLVNNGTAGEREIGVPDMAIGQRHAIGLLKAGDTVQLDGGFRLQVSNGMGDWATVLIGEST